MEFYLDEKQRKKRRLFSKLKIFAGLAVFLFLFGGIFYVVFYSQFFKIKSISVISADGVVSADDNEKLKKDLNFFFANSSIVSRFLGIDNILIWRGDFDDFLKTNPVFSTLEIEKDYWNKEVIIKFAKREKFGIWCLQSVFGETRSEERSECWWFDKDGIVFEKSPKAEGKMIYKVNDNSNRILNLADAVLDEKLFNNLKKIFEVLQKSGLNVKTFYIEDFNLEEVEIKPVGNSLPKIYFSLRFDPGFSLAAIESLKKSGLEKIQYIDFRMENRVYYK